MTIYAKQSGTWTSVAAPFVKLSGTWTAVQFVFRNIGGTWTQIYPDGTLFSNGVSTDTFVNQSTGAYSSTITSAVTDSNGNLWTHIGGDGLIQYLYSPVGSGTNETRVRIAANVSETYWSRMTLGSTGSILRSSRTSFTAWNGTYTQWVFAGNGLQIGLGSLVLKIYA